MSKFETMTLDELFKAASDYDEKNLLRCRKCIHRKRYALNEYSPKVVH